MCDSCNLPLHKSSAQEHFTFVPETPESHGEVVDPPLIRETVPSEPGLKSVKLVKKPHKCTLCDYKTDAPGNLKIHTRKHTGERPYKCDICSYTSTRKWNLTSHKQTHVKNLTGERPYKCDMCSYSAVLKSSLVVHKRSHTGEKPYKCDMCSFLTA